MSAERPPLGQDEEHWREFLTKGGGDSLMRGGRRLFTMLPSDPRCRLCTAPFAGAGARSLFGGAPDPPVPAAEIARRAPSAIPGGGSPAAGGAAPLPAAGGRRWDLAPTGSPANRIGEPQVPRG